MFSRRDADKLELTDSKIAVLNYSWMPEPQAEKYCRLEADPIDALCVTFWSVLSWKQSYTFYEMLDQSLT